MIPFVNLMKLFVDDGTALSGEINYAAKKQDAEEECMGDNLSRLGGEK